MTNRRANVAPIPVFQDGRGVRTKTVDITRPGDTTQYSIADVIAATTPAVGGSKFADVVTVAGRSVLLTDLLVMSSNPAATPLQGEIFIFDAPVTAVADNAAFGVSDAEIKSLVAKIAFTMLAHGNNCVAVVSGISVGITTITKDLYFLVRCANAYQPVASEVFTIRAKFLPQD